MTRLLLDEPAIATTLVDSRPTSFNWKGMHTIDRVHEHWEVDTEWWSELGHVWREYFAVTTKDGLLCVLYHDLLTGEWYVERVYD